MATECDAMLLYLHQSFVTFNEVLTSEANCWESCKTKLQQLQDQWQEKGLYGATALGAITRYKAEINWQDMAPEQFGRFYRFTFHICRDVGKRNLPMDLAVAAWRLLLRGRFRLLDRWCAFAEASQARVVTEDTWRQVLEFSRIIHEDLSNYDSAGAWAVLLDEFVEDMRMSRGRRSYNGEGGSHLSRRGSSGAELAAALYGGSAGASAAGDTGGAGGNAALLTSVMSSISPRCGNKRREPDVDVVAEQLSAMPLGAGHHQHHHQHQFGEAAGQGSHQQGDDGGLPYGGLRAGGDAHAKRHCVDQRSFAHQQQGQQQPYHPLPYHPQRPDPQQTQQQAAVAQAHAHHPFSLDGQSHCGSLEQHQHQQHPSAGNPQQEMQVVQVPPPTGTGGAGHGAGVGALPASCGGIAMASSCTASSGQQMSCSGGAGSVDSDGSQEPVATAAMECLQEPAGPTGVLHLQQCQQQRRAIRARRSGLSDIVKSAVADALGF